MHCFPSSLTSYWYFTINQPKGHPPRIGSKLLVHFATLGTTMTTLLEFIVIDIPKILGFAGLIFAIWLGVVFLFANPSKFYHGFGR